MLAGGASFKARRSAVEAREHVTLLLRDLALEPENRGALSKAGAIPVLARQLQTGTAQGQALAASALSQIALKSPEHRVQVTQQLVSLLGSEVDAVRQRAASALKDIASVGGSDTRMTVAMAGGIDRFVGLLKDGSVEAQVPDERTHASRSPCWPSPRDTSPLWCCSPRKPPSAVLLWCRSTPCGCYGSRRMQPRNGRSLEPPDSARTSSA